MKYLVSRRNFIVITMMMLVLFGLFQFSLVMKDQGNRFDVNDFNQDSKWQEGSGFTAKVLSPDDERPDGNYVVFIGKKTSEVYNTVEQWCTYSKRDLLAADSVTEYERNWQKNPEAILIDGENLNYEKELNSLKLLLQGRVPLIFCTIPGVDTVKRYPDLMTLLGIDAVTADSVDVVGWHIFPGFLLGGEKIYQVLTEEDEKRMDLELSIPWYHTFNGTKSYIIGEFEEQPKDTDIQPSLVWRYSTSSNQVFVVCGDFIKDLSGMGYLEAMMAELLEYDIYPVVNAQNFSIVNLPVFTDENAEQISKLYSRGMTALNRDLIWPNLVGVMENSDFVPTCFMTPQYEYQGKVAPSEEELVFYLKQMKEQNAEAGISMRTIQDGILKTKVAEDSRFFQEAENDYQYSSIYASAKDLDAVKALFSDPLFSEVKTIVTDQGGDDPLFCYFDKNVTQQGVTHDIFDFKYSDDLRLKGYETALAYSNVLLDMTDVAWPEDEDDEWQKRSEVLSSNATTYWKPFAEFERTTATESDLRIRRFLALNYKDEREKDTIRVKLDNFDETAYFILRTHGEQIESMEGGVFTELEDEAYLIEAREPEFSIEMITPSDHEVVE